MKISSAEYRQKCSEARKGDKNPMYGKHGDKHPMYGKHHTGEAKKKISEANKGKRIGEKNPMYGNHLSEETKRKMSEAHKGMKNPNWSGGKVKINCKICGKGRYSQPSYVKKGWARFCSRRCRSIWDIKHMKTKDTSIELAIEQELIKRNIPYLKQSPIEGIALVDFLLPNKTIIQCDGDYWHSRQINKGRDIAQDTVLFFKGYKVYRFWEKDINRSARKCIDKVLRA